jgi:hypothetical protein
MFIPIRSVYTRFSNQIGINPVKSCLNRSYDLGIGRPRVSYWAMRGFCSSYVNTTIQTSIEWKESKEQKTENEFYELAREATSWSMESCRKLAEKEMNLFPKYRIYYHWFLSIRDLDKIISERMILRENSQKIKEDKKQETIRTQQIDRLLERIHPRLDILFEGDQETKLKTQGLIFGEHECNDFSDLTNYDYLNLRSYLRIYHSESYHKLSFKHKNADDLSKAYLDFITNQAKQLIFKNTSNNNE